MHETLGADKGRTASVDLAIDVTVFGEVGNLNPVAALEIVEATGGVARGVLVNEVCCAVFVRQCKS